MEEAICASSSAAARGTPLHRALTTATYCSALFVGGMTVNIVGQLGPTLAANMQVSLEIVGNILGAEGVGNTLVTMQTLKSWPRPHASWRMPALTAPCAHRSLRSPLPALTAPCAALHAACARRSDCSTLRAHAGKGLLARQLGFATLLRPHHDRDALPAALLHRRDDTVMLEHLPGLDRLYPPIYQPATLLNSNMLKHRPSIHAIYLRLLTSSPCIYISPIPSHPTLTLAPSVLPR